MKLGMYGWILFYIVYIYRVTDAKICPIDVHF